MSLSSKSKNIKDWSIGKLKEIKFVLSQESDQTRSMLQTYLKFSVGEASADEMKEANSQFGDILKTLGLGAFVVLPFAPLTIPIAVKLGEKLGIDILPSSYRDLEAQKKQELEKKK